MNKGVVQLCREKPFGLLCDESTTRGTEKEFVTLVRIFEEESVVTKFLAMPVVNIGTAANLFESLNAVLR